ncbi:hypothetical protein QR98_0005690 [Sarcoptes scabiei]|uniref:Uncharacterized protein n=1 Tax=Sarcoptes scabiei TaxID=52283 RepID=A0A131ZTM1_SARSC|nr:hypothetical protein QR98_0005690 [Sarcoptes scabiei]
MFGWVAIPIDSLHPNIFQTPNYRHSNHKEKTNSKDFSSPSNLNSLDKSWTIRPTPTTSKTFTNGTLRRKIPEIPYKTISNDSSSTTVSQNTLAFKNNLNRDNRNELEGRQNQLKQHQLDLTDKLNAPLSIDHQGSSIKSRLNYEINERLLAPFKYHQNSNNSFYNNNNNNNNNHQNYQSKQKQNSNLLSISSPPSRAIEVNAEKLIRSRNNAKSADDGRENFERNFNLDNDGINRYSYEKHLNQQSLLPTNHNHLTDYSGENYESDSGESTESKSSSSSATRTSNQSLKDHSLKPKTINGGQSRMKKKIVRRKKIKNDGEQKAIVSLSPSGMAASSSTNVFGESYPSTTTHLLTGSLMINNRQNSRPPLFSSSTKPPQKITIALKRPGDNDSMPIKMTTIPVFVRDERNQLPMTILDLKPPKTTPKPSLFELISGERESLQPRMVSPQSESRVNVIQENHHQDKIKKLDSIFDKPPPSSSSSASAALNIAKNFNLNLNELDQSFFVNDKPSTANEKHSESFLIVPMFLNPKHHHHQQYSSIVSNRNGMNLARYNSYIVIPPGQNNEHKNRVENFKMNSQKRLYNNNGNNNRYYYQTQISPSSSPSPSLKPKSVIKATTIKPLDKLTTSSLSSSASASSTALKADKSKTMKKPTITMATTTTAKEPLESLEEFIKKTIQSDVDQKREDNGNRKFQSKNRNEGVRIRTNELNYLNDSSSRLFLLPPSSPSSSSLLTNERNPKHPHHHHPPSEKFKPILIKSTTTPTHHYHYNLIDNDTTLATFTPSYYRDNFTSDARKLAKTLSPTPATMIMEPKQSTPMLMTMMLMNEKPKSEQQLYKKIKTSKPQI